MSTPRLLHPDHRLLLGLADVLGADGGVLAGKGGEDLIRVVDQDRQCPTGVTGYLWKYVSSTLFRSVIKSVSDRSRTFFEDSALLYAS
jgi:hypothetical protein